MKAFLPLNVAIQVAGLNVSEVSGAPVKRKNVTTHSDDRLFISAFFDWADTSFTRYAWLSRMDAIITSHSCVSTDRLISSI